MQTMKISFNGKVQVK